MSRAPALLPLLEEANLFDPECTTQDYVKTLAKLPLSFQPGASWGYGQSHHVLGCLVEVISGMPLDFQYDRYGRNWCVSPIRGTMAKIDASGLNERVKLGQYRPVLKEAITYAVRACRDPASGIVHSPCHQRGRPAVHSLPQSTSRQRSALALAHSKTGDLESAIDDMSRLIEVHPDHADAYNERGMLRGKLERYELQPEQKEQTEAALRELRGC
jgi:tetratricopeptide (TPR) repeat protein